MTSPITNCKTILILVAMDVEEKAILKNIDFETKTYGHRFSIQTKHFFANDYKIILAKTGVGLVNAALTLTFIYDNESIDAVIAMGVGGALSPNLTEGDLVIANQVIQHDSILSNDEENKWIAAGELTLSASDDEQINPIISCDPDLTSWLEKSFAAIPHSHSIHKGTILSGSEFVANAKRKSELYKNFNHPLLVEMEAGAIAQMSRRLNIPFAILKTVSDTANPKTTVSEDYKTFVKEASLNSENLLKILFGLN